MRIKEMCDKGTNRGGLNFRKMRDTAAVVAMTALTLTGLGLANVGAPGYAQQTAPMANAPENGQRTESGAGGQGDGTANSTSSALKIDTASQKVPAGTLLTVAFNTHMDSRITQNGDPFTAFIQQDFVSGSRVILPKGTVVRGRVTQVKKPGLFSRGGSISLDFDHVMLPSGDLLPLELNLSSHNSIVNQKGNLYTDPGIGKKVNKSVEKGVNTFSKIKDAGYEAGKNAAGGLGVIVTVPAAAVGGALAGTAVTTGKAAVAVVGKGDSVVINPGDTVTIDFGGSFNLPAQ